MLYLIRVTFHKQWDEKLAQHAYNYISKSIQQTGSCPQKHSKRDNSLNMGENMSWGQRDFKDRVTQWVVWANTKYVGCAIANNCPIPRGVTEILLICNYSPAGNVEGQYPYKISGSADGDKSPSPGYDGSNNHQPGNVAIGDRNKYGKKPGAGYDGPNPRPGFPGNIAIGDWSKHNDKPNVGWNRKPGFPGNVVIGSRDRPNAGSDRRPGFPGNVVFGNGDRPNAGFDRRPGFPGHVVFGNGDRPNAGSDRRPGFPGNVVSGNWNKRKPGFGQMGGGYPGTQNFNRWNAGHGGHRAERRRPDNRQGPTQGGISWNYQYRK
uniref:SCP domain-containing protein n=1 Tax=Romanomermis culicivorax TaxID=13658 RepID=A0A915I483_ROMCU